MQLHVIHGKNVYYIGFDGLSESDVVIMSNGSVLCYCMDFLSSGTPLLLCRNNGAPSIICLFEWSLWSNASRYFLTVSLDVSLGDICNFSFGALTDL